MARQLTPLRHCSARGDKRRKLRSRVLRIGSGVLPWARRARAQDDRSRLAVGRLPSAVSGLAGTSWYEVLITPVRRLLPYWRLYSIRRSDSIRCTSFVWLVVVDDRGAGLLGPCEMGPGVPAGSNLPGVRFLTAFSSVVRTSTNETFGAPRAFNANIRQAHSHRKPFGALFREARRRPHQRHSTTTRNAAPHPTTWSSNLIPPIA